jgi:hypothetical protein
MFCDTLDTISVNDELEESPKKRQSDSKNISSNKKTKINVEENIEIESLSEFDDAQTLRVTALENELKSIRRLLDKYILTTSKNLRKIKNRLDNK